MVMVMMMGVMGMPTNIGWAPTCASTELGPVRAFLTVTFQVGTLNISNLQM